MRRYATIALLAAALPGLSACEPEREAQKKPPRLVEVVKVQSRPVSDVVTTTGEVSARVQSDLSFRVSGRIIERLVDIGDHVTSGQILARIDPQEQKADLQVARATLQSAQAQQTQARQAYDRQQSLFNTGVTTRAALDQAQETLLTGQGTVQSAQAQVDTARDALEQTELKADADGIITARNAEVGQVAQAAQLIFTLAHDGPRDAVIEADETMLLGGEIQNDIVVKLLSGGNDMKASVREISPTLDTSTGTIRVKLTLESKADVRLGSPVVAIAHYKPVNTIELPSSAMTSLAGRPAVWLIDPKTAAVSLREIKVGKYANGHFSVMSGLSEGEVVVVNGTKFLALGETVTYEGAAQ